MKRYQDFSSLPAAEEQAFVVYEERTVETGKKAMIFGLVAAAILTIATIAIVFSHEKPQKGHQMAGDDLGTLVQPDRPTGANAPAVSAPEAEAPATSGKTETTP